MSAITTAGAGKAVRKNAAFEVFAKGLAHIGLGSAVVALPIVLTRAGQLQPGLEMFGYCFAKQRALGVARVVEFGPHSLSVDSPVLFAMAMA